MIEKKCYVCGKIYYTYPCNIKRSKYCSDKCRKEATCFKKGQIPWNKGKKLNEWISKEKLEEMRKKGFGFKKGHIPWNKGLTKEVDERLKRMSKKFKGRPNPKLNEIKKKFPPRGMLGKHHTEKTRKKISETKKRLYKEGKIKPWNKGKKLGCEDPKQKIKRLKKIFEALRKRPTKPERKLMEILNKYFPNEFAYNGDFSQGVMLGGLIPDFINVNGRKIVIEVFGDYWHKERKNIPWYQTEWGRKAIYSQLGYKCIVIWEHELKTDEKVYKRVEEVLR